MIMSLGRGAGMRHDDNYGARFFAVVAGCLIAVFTAIVWSAAPVQAAYGPDTWRGYGKYGYVGNVGKRKSRLRRGVRKYTKRSSRRARRSGKRRRYAALGNSARYGYKAKRRASKKRKVRSSRRKARKAAKPRRYAALGTTATDAVAPKPALKSTGGIRWVASSSCLNGTLRSVVSQIAANYGSVTVNSTCRSRSRNRRVGGARKSHHLTGNAVDFRVRGNVRAVYAYLRSHSGVGGLKHYGGGLFHIDTGPRRSW